MPAFFYGGVGFDFVAGTDTNSTGATSATTVWWATLCRLFLAIKLIKSALVMWPLGPLGVTYSALIP